MCWSEMGSSNVLWKFYIQNIGEAVELEVKLCDEVETVSEFTYVGDSVSAVEDE